MKREINNGVKKLNEIYGHLHKIGEVYTQKDFAGKINRTEEGISAAFNGNKRYLTEGIFKQVCKIYPDVFNQDYFLKDMGEMLKNNQQIRNIENSNVVGANISGSGNSISGVSSELIGVIKIQQEQIGKLINVIDKLSEK